MSHNPTEPINEYEGRSLDYERILSEAPAGANSFCPELGLYYTKHSDEIRFWNNVHKVWIKSSLHFIHCPGVKIVIAQ